MHIVFDPHLARHAKKSKIKDFVFSDSQKVGRRARDEKSRIDRRSMRQPKLVRRALHRNV